MHNGMFYVATQYFSFETIFAREKTGASERQQKKYGTEKYKRGQLTKLNEPGKERKN